MATEDYFLIGYLALAALTVAQAALATLQARENLRFARSRMRELAFWWPKGRVALFAPCKGVDPGLEENLQALFAQDHADYELTFIVESAQDEACLVIRRAMASHPHVPARLVVAGRAHGCAQKVHNLRVATAGLSPEIKYVAFVDSDARPRPQWLRALVLRLGRQKVGAVTGYRWFVPERPTWANYFLCAMNASVAMLCGPGGHYLVWGGSWAMRRKTFDEWHIRQAWAGRLVDDVVASARIVREDRQILFEPACMVASPLDVSWPQLFGFVRRQYFLVRHHFPRWWRVALLLIAGAGLGLCFHVAAVGAALGGWLPLWLPLTVALLVYALGMARATIRHRMTAVYFPRQEEQFRGPARFDLWAAPLAAVLHLAGLLASAWGREITWRGVRYRINAHGRAEELTRADSAILHAQPCSAKRRAA